MSSSTRLTRHRSLLAAGAALGALVAATPALAQNNNAAPETVVVTGSRIPVENALSPSPISTVSASQIQLTSAFNAEDVLNKMVGPDATAGITNATNNGANGLSQLGLRNLGPTRTLVLIDGQRLVPVFSGSTSVPDLNSLPISMIDRVEVLRDGASSIYGADAIGGVINFITKRDFEGFQVDVNTGASEHGGGDLYSVTGTMGINFDKGNLTLSLVNEHQSPVDMKDRAWSIDPHIGQGDLEGGSTFRNQLNILQDEISGTVWNGGRETDVTDPSLGSVPCLTYLPAAGRARLNAGCPDVHPNATLASSLGRTQMSWNGHYDLMSDVTFAVSGFFTRRDSEQRIRPEPLLGDSIASTDPQTGVPVFGGFMVPTSFPGYTDPNGTASPVTCPDPTGANAHNGGAAPTCIASYLTPNNFGPRDYKQVSTTYRIRAGLEGKIFGDYNWEVGYVQQRNDATLRTYNSGNWYNLAQATAQMPCINVPGGCSFNPLFGYNTPTTPFNFFNGANTLTPDQVKYLTTTLTETQYTYENYIYADVNGPIMDLPAGKLQGSIGFERRFEYASDSPDALVQAGYAANPSAPTAGGYGVTSFYGELRIPVLKDLPFAEFLTLTPSGRFDHYSSFGDALTWKIGGEWQLIDDIRVRGSYATGFRAPSTAELFGGQAVSYLTVAGDPCDTRVGVNSNPSAGLGSLAPGSACFTQLTAQGLTPAQIAAYQSPENNVKQDQRGIIIGGNPKLKPELSRSWNLGAVITPTFLPGLTFNGDYYEIKITNSILDGGIATNATPDIVTLGCYVDQNPAYCSQISRNGSGIFQIQSLNANFGVSQVRGLDMELTYNTDAAGITLPVPGAFQIDLQGEREFLNTTQNPDFSTNEFVGFYSTANDSIQPRWKATASVDYRLEDLGLHYDMRYIGGTEELGGSDTGYGFTLPAILYHNIAVSYDLPEIGPSKSTRLVLGINNLFDKDPPFLVTDSIGKSNSLAGPYDVTGRFFFARISTKF